jgi:preprotein translocase subunit SecG
MSILINFLLVLYVLVAVLMVFVILMQRPKSEGLGAAFGGGVTENIFGAQTTNVLVKFTAWLAGIFFAITFALSILYAHKSAGDSGLRRELMKQQTSAGVSPSPATTQPSPVSSPAPDSGAGVVPAGSATPAAISPAPAAASPAAAANAAQSPAATPRAKKRKP